MSIPEQADSILEALSVEPGLTNAPLILVGHSLGGLVIKTMVQHGLQHNVGRHRKIVERIKGIVFIGTPHFGSGWASLMSWIPFSRENAQVRNLKKDDPHLLELHKAVLATLDRRTIRTRVYVESKEVSLRKIFGLNLLPSSRVVSAASSEPHIPGETGVPIPTDHISICKPKDKNQLIHKSLLKFVIEVQGLVQSEVKDPMSLSTSPVFQSDDFEAIEANERKDTPVHLAVGTYGMTEGAATEAVCTCACIVSDEPEKLSKGLADLWFRVKRDPLVPIGVKKSIEQTPLRDLVLNPTTQTIVLSALSTISFSGYVYYAFASVYNNMPEEQRRRIILIELLVHRMSKKGERFVQVHSQIPGIQALLQDASAEIELRFHRNVDIPKPGLAKYARLEELATLIAWSLGQHLSQLSNPMATAIFESIRTRLRYAENVVTRDKHKRDMNPLP